MQDMRDQLILAHLKELGFSEENVRITDSEIVFIDFQNEVERGNLKEEGTLIENFGNDNYYHNYVYQDGLIPGFDQITLEKYTDGPYYSAENPENTRIKTISIPLTAIHSQDFKPEDFVANINLTYGTTHTCRVVGNPQRMVLAVDYTSGRGKTPAEELLRGLLTELQPRIPHKGDIAGPNYISHLGRLAHILHPSAMDQAMNRLMRASNNDVRLLGLRDQVVDAPAHPSLLRIDKSIFQRWVDKEAREEQLLSRRVVANLGMNAKNWVAADIRAFRFPEERSEKFRAALAGKDDPNNPPLYISTTSGQHAFAMMIDFKTKTVFLANPLGTYDGFDEIVEQAKRISGCEKVVYVNTKPLVREGDIPFQDVCTADSVALVYMMQVYHAEHGDLGLGCLNEQPLKTAEYITSEMVERHPVEENDSAKGFVDELHMIEEEMETQFMSAESAEQGWEKATQLLGKQEDYISTDTRIGARSVQYSVDMGPRIIVKMVPEAAQIILDRLYAKKLAAGDDNQYRPSY